MVYDLAKIRADFPILSREINGQPLTYLDNGASAQKPQSVIDAVSHAYSHSYANVHRGLHTLSNEATEAYEAARGKVRAFLNAPSDEEIIFTKGSTEAINLVASSFGQDHIGEGDEIILSILEHHSNIIPWHYHREKKGAVLKWAPVDDNGNFLFEEFAKLITPRTKMIAITHMSNAIGSIVPIKQVVELAHSHGIPVLVDGSQGAVHLPVDVQDLGCDFYVATGHKLYGPSGIGVLYGKREWLEKLPPYQGGGEMIRDVYEDKVVYEKPPHRFEAGTPPIVQAIGLGAALDYMENIGRDNIARHEEELRRYAHEKLSAINALRIIGTADDKGAIMSFAMQGVHAHDISAILDKYGVAVRAGTHCAQPLLRRFGVSSTCRASFGLYNSFDDVDRLVNSLNKAQMLFA